MPPPTRTNSGVEVGDRSLPSSQAAEVAAGDQNANPRNAASGARSGAAERLCVEPLAKRSRPGDICKENGAGLTRLLAPRIRRCQRAAAGVTEASSLRVLFAAARAPGHGESVLAREGGVAPSLSPRIPHPPERPCDREAQFTTNNYDRQIMRRQARPGIRCLPSRRRLSTPSLDMLRCEEADEPAPWPEPQARSTSAWMASSSCSSSASSRPPAIRRTSSCRSSSLFAKLPRLWPRLRITKRSPTG